MRTSRPTAASGSASARKSSRTLSGWPRSFSVSSTTRSGIAYRPAPEAALEVVDVSPGQAGEGRAQESVQVGAPAFAPLEAQEREERLAERRLADADSALDRIRHLERRKERSRLRSMAFDARADEEDLLGRVPALTSFSTSSATSSSVPRAPAPSRNRIAPSSGGAGGGSSANRCRSRCASPGGATSL